MRADRMSRLAKRLHPVAGRRRARSHAIPDQHHTPAPGPSPTRATIVRRPHLAPPAPAVLVRSGSGSVVGYHQGRPEPELQRRRHQPVWPHQPAFRACRKVAAAVRPGCCRAWWKSTEAPHAGDEAPQAWHRRQLGRKFVLAFGCLEVSASRPGATTRPSGSSVRSNNRSHDLP